MPTDPTTVETFEGDLASFVRSLLAVSAAQLPDTRIGGQYDRMTDRLNQEYLLPAGQITGVSAPLGGTDLLYFNEAIGYMIAVKLFAVKYGQGSGLTTEVKVGNFDFRFAAPQGDVRDGWTRDALADLNLVSVIRNLLATENAWSFNTVQGPSRSAKANGRVRGLVDALLDIYQDRDAQSLLSI